MVVVDANITVALFVRMPYSEKAEKLFIRWHKQNTPLFAPSLWHAEVISALRKMVVAGQIPEDQAESAIQNLAGLHVDVILPDPDLLIASFEWARKLDQMVAYDAQYLALAERLGAALWTGDRRLFNRLKSSVAWLHWVEEI